MGPRTLLRPRARRAAVLAGLLMAVSLPATRAGAQTWQTAPDRQRPGWLGIGYELRWIERGDACRPEVLVSSVVRGSPAQRAGLRAGDALLALDGDRLGAFALQRLSGRLVAGDSIRIRFVRGGAQREVTAVADLRPERVAIAPPSPLVVERTAPVIEIRGDSLVATNVEPERAWNGPLPPGYWVAHGDGRTEFRRLSSWSLTPLDDRVVNLVQCARTARLQAQVAAMPAPPALIHARAESLRIAFTRRALEAGVASPDPGAVFRFLPPPPAGAAPPAPGVPDAPRALVFSVEEHLAAGMRAVAGAELTTLESELADYFPGASEGLLVLRVAPGSPAATAGLRPGDVITAGNGRPVQDVAGLRSLLSVGQDDAVTLRVVRHGKAHTVTIPRG